MARFLLSLKLLTGKKNDKKSKTLLVSFWQAVEPECKFTEGVEEVWVIPIVPATMEEGDLVREGTFSLNSSMRQSRLPTGESRCSWTMSSTYISPLVVYSVHKVFCGC